MSDADIVERLKSIDHMNGDECFLDSLYAEAATEITALRQRVEDAHKALRAIAEGNLGDLPWQANYEVIRIVARNALPETTRALLEKGEKDVASKN